MQHKKLLIEKYRIMCLRWSNENGDRHIQNIRLADPQTILTNHFSNQFLFANP